MTDRSANQASSKTEGTKGTVGTSPYPRESQQFPKTKEPENTANLMPVKTSLSPEPDQIQTPKINRPEYRTHDDWFLLDGLECKPGLYFHTWTNPKSNADPEPLEIWICTPIHADAITANEREEAYGLMLRFVNPDGNWREWLAPMHLLKGSMEELRGELLDMGVRIDPKHRMLMAQWMIHTATILAPLMDLLHQQLLASRVLQMDETPVQVLKEPGKTPQSKSYMWVTLSGSSDPPVVWYDYDPGRGRAVPERLLGDYTGYLVTDGYAGYQSVTSRHQITGIGCWAHARRKFDEAMKVQGKQSKRSGRAHYAMSEIRKLYAIERKIQSKRQDEKYQIRQTQAKPIIDKLRTWLDKTRPQVPPKTTLGKALRYLDNEWTRLIRYLDDGELPIDNNRCENAIRPFVIGRKNWMFSASQGGARASATLYSLIETAKHNGLEPYRYLRFILTEIAKGQEDATRLLPFNLNPEEIDC